MFPLICLTEDEIEMFTEDPAEFSRTHFGGAQLRPLPRVAELTISTAKTSSRTRTRTLAVRL